MRANPFHPFNPQGSCILSLVVPGVPQLSTFFQHDTVPARSPQPQTRSKYLVSVSKMETSTMPTRLFTPPSHNTRLQQQSRSSICSLYDLLADLDETQLQYLVQEMNHTAPQNMAVSQAISAIETENPSYALASARQNMQAPKMQRQMSKSQRLRLSLQTMFRAPSVRQQRRQQQQDVDDGLVEDITPRSRRKSPAYKRISRPNFNLPPGVTIMDLLNLLEAEFLYNNSTSQLSPASSSFSPSSSFSSSPSPTTSFGSGRIRRYPSTIDMALEAERSTPASSVEGIGLGMLEPRPTTPACATPRTPISFKSSPSTPIFDRSLRGETPPAAPPIVLEGIFEVLEHK